ncbi:Tripartite motif-containing protein 55 [Collichthys lucidus]|uniref:RING-type E3 ubiquitin transferase n=1 Tax=Collichthys lucidus TaxID=240159 RepID=A0A4U5TW19_COLLU|nr:Tripartite motif-containing protein 55 [Collichthys lucidus]
MPRPLQASNPYLSTRSGSTVTSGGRFRCPSCRHEVVLDRHGVYGLQRNLLVENIIDMYKQGNGSRQVPEVKQEQPMCDDHKEERINIYCVTCSVPTCSLCKVFGAHKDCEVAPLDNIFQTQKAELSDCISMLVGNNERIQAIISQLEETCRAVDENGRRQKSKVCESFDHLFALLEERKGELTLRISCEQEEKLDYIRGLRRKHSEHLENAAKLLETAIQTLDESEMAVFLQATKPLLQKIVESADTSHLDKIQHGYEKMEHFRTNCERQRRALMNVDFIKREQHGKSSPDRPITDETPQQFNHIQEIMLAYSAKVLNAVDEDDEDEDVEVRGSTTGSRVEQSHAAGLSANQQPPLSPVQPAPPPQRPSEAPPTATPQTKSSTPSSSQAPPPMPLPIAGSTPQSDQQNESEDKDGPKHVFSFSWLNQK